MQEEDILDFHVDTKHISPSNSDSYFSQSYLSSHSHSFSSGCIKLNSLHTTSKTKKNVSFDEQATIYLFERCIGVSTIPIQGIPLGMETKHFEIETTNLKTSDMFVQKEFQMDAYQRRAVLVQEGISLENSYELLQSIEVIRQSRRELPLCACGNAESNGACGQTKACYCAFNEIDCHEWCMCKKSCNKHEHAYESSSKSISSLQNQIPIDSNQNFINFEYLSKADTLNGDSLSKKTKSNGLKMIYVVNGLIFGWLLMNSIYTFRGLLPICP